MANICIGIVGNDNVGNDIAYYLSNKGFKIVVLTVNDYGEIDFDEEKKIIKMRNMKGKFFNVASGDDKITWLQKYDQLSNVDFLIEAVNSSLEYKQLVLSKLEKISYQASTPLMTSGRFFYPSKVASKLEDPSRVVGIYLYDIAHGNNNAEIVRHSKCSKEILEKVEKLFQDAGFKMAVMKECTGFIHNRIGLLGFMCLLKFYDDKILSLKELSKYIVVTKVGIKRQFNLTLGTEASYELVEARKLFVTLSEDFGNDRFVLPKYINKYKNITEENMFELIGQDSVEDYSIQDHGYEVKKFKKVYIRGIHPIYNNIIFPMIREDVEFYFDQDESEEYFKEIKDSSTSLCDKLIKKSTFIKKDTDYSVDLVMDFSIELFDEKVRVCSEIQKRFGINTPILLNTPIHKIGDIAKKSLNPSMIYGMYTQKLYLSNTELVINDIMDKQTYISIRSFVEKLASGYIETKDTYVRPLAYFIVAKLLEAARILEEGIATKEAISTVGVDGDVFSYMDLFGLDNILKICNYLKPIYGRTFSVPQIITNMQAEGKKFY